MPQPSPTGVRTTHTLFAEPNLLLGLYEGMVGFERAMTLSAVTFRPPRIETKRLTLRGYESSDAADIYEYASDSETTRFMAWDRATTLEDVQSFLNSVVAPNYEREELDYAVTLRGMETRCIGGLGLYWRPQLHRVMELGYILHRMHWGQGLIAEAGRTLIAHAFASTPVERIFAPVFAVNSRSRHLAEKLGMDLDGILRSHVAMRGQRWDVAIYSLIRTDVTTGHFDEGQCAQR